jgi:hypothetical protein
MYEELGETSFTQLSSHHLRNPRITPSMATIGTSLLGLLLAVCCATTVVHGQKERIVGDDKGWTFGVSGWENGKRIQSGDVLGKNTGD